MQFMDCSPTPCAVDKGMYAAVGVGKMVVVNVNRLTANL